MIFDNVNNIMNKIKSFLTPKFARGARRAPRATFSSCRAPRATVFRCARRAARAFAVSRAAVLASLRRGATLCAILATIGNAAPEQFFVRQPIRKGRFPQKTKRIVNLDTLVEFIE